MADKKVVDKKVSNKKGSGEKQIEKILRELDIPFSKTKRLTNLKKDAKKFRVPDFYIEKYNLIIEFFGGWYNEKNKALEKRERSRFMEKVGAYEESGINCLYLYPEDYDNFEKKILDKIKEIKDKNKANKIIKSIYVKKKTKQKKVDEDTSNQIVEEKPKEEIQIEKKEKVKEEKIIIQKENIVFDDYQPKKKDYAKPLEKKKGKNNFKRIILLLDTLCFLLFCFISIITTILVLSGNPLVSDLHSINAGLFYLFIIGIILSIIFSFLFAIEKEISKGLIYVSVILVIFFFILVWFFGNPLFQTILLLISVFGIIPSQFFMVMEN